MLIFSGLLFFQICLPLLYQLLNTCTSAKFCEIFLGWHLIFRFPGSDFPSLAAWRNLAETPGGQFLAQRQCRSNIDSVFELIRRLKRRPCLPNRNRTFFQDVSLFLLLRRNVQVQPAERSSMIFPSHQVFITTTTSW
jgi:hypothetical protein